MILFVTGCGCRYSITYGFELLNGAESSRVLFRFFMTRLINRIKLEGIIYDNACNLQKFFLNRDPRDFKFTRFIVDGCHFAGQKKQKKGNFKTGSNGHLGCSSSYNYMEYKKYISEGDDGASNSQGREQINSVLNRMAPSLRQMSYHFLFLVVNN